MRITDSLKYAILNKNLARIKQQIDTTQNKIASGKRITTPSDDPVSASSGIGLEAEKNMNNQYIRNLERLKTLGGFYDTGITSIHDLLTKAKEIAITQASSTMDDKTRKSSAEEIKGIIEQLVTIGNTKIGNSYIFGGEKAGVVPFTLESDYAVTFNGSENVSSVYVDKGTKEASGISGYKVFISDNNIFDGLKKLKDGLEANDQSKIAKSLDDLEAALSKTQANISHVGTYVSKIQSYIEYKDTRNLDIDGSLSQMMDVDIAQAVTEFNALSTAYEAMLYSMAKIQNLSVLNYLQ
ncbi:MAG TPA: flagellar hook-associated protein FlgL [Syntrophorhabdaceae bacterium]|nr:flagellar hook-associated protein FlgL [Syntrophorhabdaceae bacterium]